MSTRFEDVTIGSESYKLPLNGSSAPWGEELSDLIDALIEISNEQKGAYDITTSTASILNTSGAKDINGLLFNNSYVRSAVITFNSVRSITKSIATNGIPVASAGVVTITCTDDHDLYTGDTVTIASSTSTPSIDGSYTVTRTAAKTFTITIAAPVTVAGSGSFSVEIEESGRAFVGFSTNKGWRIATRVEGDSKITLDIDSNGQVKYTPTILEGSSYLGTIKFSAKSFEV